jgi:phage gp29-like protein
MRKIPQPIDLRPSARTFDWQKHYGRLRIGYLNRTMWWLYGFRKLNWFFVFRNYKKYNYEVNEPASYFQLTIFGFQVAYLYKGQVPTTNGKLL